MPNRHHHLSLFISSMSADSTNDQIPFSLGDWVTDRNNPGRRGPQRVSVVRPDRCQHKTHARYSEPPRPVRFKLCLQCGRDCEHRGSPDAAYSVTLRDIQKSNQPFKKDLSRTF